MKSQDFFKEQIKDGIIGVPKNENETINLLDRYFEISKIKDEPTKRIEEYKNNFLKVQKYKSTKDGGAYISTIKSGLNTLANKKLNDVVFAWYGVDLTTYAIQRLIVDGKIKLIGKKVYLINQPE